MANKEYFILLYFQRIGKLHYLLLLLSRTAALFFFTAISNAKVVFIEFPPFINEFTHFVMSNALSNDGRYQKSFQGVFFCQSPPHLPNSAVVHRSLARQLSIPRDTLTTKPSSRASSYENPNFKKLAAFRPRTTFSSEKRSKSRQCKSTREC